MLTYGSFYFLYGFSLINIEDSTPLYYFHRRHRHLDISRGITEDSTSLLAASPEPGTFSFRAQVANH